MAYDNGAFGNDLKVMSGVTDVTKNYRLADTDKTAGTLTINKAQNPMEVESTASVKRGGNTIDLSKKVSGAVGAVSYGISEMEVYCSITAAGVLTSGSDTGKCTVQVCAAGDDNHEPETLYITVTVTDKDDVTVELTQTGITYGQTLPDPDYSKPAEGGIETLIYSGTKADGTSYGPTAEKPTDAGSYTVGLSYDTDDKVYHGSASFTIARKQITVRVANKSAVYTGFEQSGESEPRFSGVPGGHTAAISYTPAKGTAIGIYTNGSFGNDLRVMSGQTDVTVNFDLTKKTTGTLTITGTLPYTITYYLDGGSNNEANPDFYTEEDEGIILADPAKAGDAYAAEYIFGGWFEDDAFMKPVANTPESPAIPKGSTGERTFYARWAAVTVDQKTEIPEGALDSLSVSQETAAAIISDTKVEGVALQSSGDAGGNTGALDTILEMAAEGGSGIEAKDANGNPLPQTAAAEKMAEAAAVEVTITVNVTPQTFEENSMTVFKLDPVASITAKDENGDTTAEISGVKVDNSMIDQSQPIVVSLYTGFKPVQVVHYDDRNRVIDVFTADNITYNEGTGICQVTIYRFSYIRTNNAENQQTIYEVSFDANGGSPVKTQQVVSGKNADKPDDPKKDGYGFMGWFQKTESGVSDTAFSFDSEITGDIVLAAKWGRKVSYAWSEPVPQGVNLPALPGDGLAEPGSTVSTAGDPTAPEGYGFGGWIAPEGLVVAGDGSFTMPDEDVAFTGSWSPAAYTITLLEVGETGASFTVQVNGQAASAGADGKYTAHYQDEVIITFVPGEKGVVIPAGTLAISKDGSKPVDFAPEQTADITESTAFTITGGMPAGNITVKASEIVAPPAANDRTYDGTAKPLVTAGAYVSGTMYYLGVSESELNGLQPEQYIDYIRSQMAGFSNNIPEKKDAGKYYVWYARMDFGSYSFNPDPVEVTVAPLPVTIRAKDQTVGFGGTINTDPNGTGTDQIEIKPGSLVGDDAITSVTLNVSGTTITPSAAKVNGDNTATGNYSFIYEDGTLTVTLPPINIQVVYENGAPFVADIGLNLTGGSVSFSDWNTSDPNENPHKVTGLLSGVKYTLKEKSVSHMGYKFAADTQFSFDASGNITYYNVDGAAAWDETDRTLTIKNERPSVAIRKVNVKGNPLAGAVLLLTDEEGESYNCENCTWQSSDTADHVLIINRDKVYGIKEETPPAGYKLSSSPLLTFKLTDDGRSVDPKSISGGSIAEDGAILIVNEPISVSIKKVDGNGNALSGAKLQRVKVDAGGNEEIFDVWISTAEAAVITGKLAVGVPYILREAVPPAGYKPAADVTFELKADGTIDTDKTKTTAEVENGVILFRSEGIGYTVKFDKNADDAQDPQGSMTEQTFVYGVEQALRPNAFTRDGYSFAGWKIKGGAADGQNVAADYEESKLTTDDGSTVILAAQWRLNSYTVKVVPGRNMTMATGSGEVEQTVAKGTEITDVVYTADEGYYFPEDYAVDTDNGISVTRDSNSQITVSGKPTADTGITLTAPAQKGVPNITKNPKGAEDLMYSENVPQKLLEEPGEVKNGTILYRVEGEQDFSEKEPERTGPGSYTVEWYVKGNENYGDLGSPKNPCGSIIVLITETEDVIADVYHVQRNGSYGIPYGVKDLTLSFTIRVMNGDQVVAEAKNVSLKVSSGDSKVEIPVVFNGKVTGQGYTVSLVGLPAEVRGGVPGSEGPAFRLSYKAWITDKVTIYLTWDDGQVNSEPQKLRIYALPEDEIGAYSILDDGTKEYLIFHTYDICMAWLGSDELCSGYEHCFHKSSPYENPFAKGGYIGEIIVDSN